MSSDTCQLRPIHEARIMEFRGLTLAEPYLKATDFPRNRELDSIYLRFGVRRLSRGLVVGSLEFRSAPELVFAPLPIVWILATRVGRI